ncbi:MAG: hypothetical protein QNJ97_19700 [Myxococcota bacterium]|nr:hypothetical protein [Myxococcota bacterium]
MSEDTSNRTTSISQERKKKRAGESPLMSYTAVTSQNRMAQAFVDELIRVGKKMLPDRDLSIEDLISICQVALQNKTKAFVMLEGRHLRGRISDQMSRANRYGEFFSLLVLKLEDLKNKNDYDSVVDTLCERMRRTDLMFLFKSRVVLVLPHTKKEACLGLRRRINDLIGETLRPAIEYATLTYPDPQITKKSHVLDWAEDQLRT